MRSGAVDVDVSIDNLRGKRCVCSRNVRVIARKVSEHRYRMISHEVYVVVGPQRHWQVLNG